MIRVTTTSTEAEIQERGAYLTHFRFKGKDIVLPGAERQTRGGMALLIPFANRVRGGAYQWDGKTYELPRNKEGNAIHGLVMDKEWTVGRVDPERAELSLLLEHEGYPVPLLIRVEYSLDPQSLTWRASVRNEGERRAPLVVGTHPYFLVRGNWSLSPNVGKRCITREKIPTGETEDFVILNGEYDDCFFLPGELTLSSSYSTLRIERENMDFLQLFTGVPGALAIEPMSGAPDAYHNGLGLKVLNPGEEVRFWFKVKVLRLAD